MTPIAVLSESASMVCVGLITSNNVPDILLGVFGSVILVVSLTGWAWKLWSMSCRAPGILRCLRFRHGGIKLFVQPRYEWVLVNANEEPKNKKIPDGSDAQLAMSPAEVAYLDRHIALIGSSWWMWSAFIAVLLSIITGVAEGWPASETMCKVRWLVASTAATLQAVVVMTNTVPIELLLLGIAGAMSCCLIVLISLSTFDVTESDMAFTILNVLGTSNSIISIVLMLCGLAASRVEGFMEYFRRKKIREITADRLKSHLSVPLFEFSVRINEDTSQNHAELNSAHNDTNELDIELPESTSNINQISNLTSVALHVKPGDRIIAMPAQWASILDECEAVADRRMPSQSRNHTNSFL